MICVEQGAGQLSMFLEWMTEFFPSDQHAAVVTFCLNTVWTPWFLDLLIPPSTMTKAPGPAEDRQPKAWSFHHVVLLVMIPFGIQNLNLGFIRAQHTHVVFGDIKCGGLKKRIASCHQPGIPDRDRTKKPKLKSTKPKDKTWLGGQKVWSQGQIGQDLANRQLWWFDRRSMQRKTRWDQSS